MTKTKRVLSLALALLLAFSCFAAPVFAAGAEQTDSAYSVSERLEHGFYQVVDKLIRLLGRFLNMVIPGKDWAGKIPSLRSYTPEQFYPGKDSFDAAPAPDAEWSMGYAARSFLDGIDATDGTYFMAGSLEAFKGRAAVKVLDDQGVVSWALSDGDTTVTFSSVDGFGLTRGDVREIRARLADFAAENGIDSINVGALHQHSGIDTLGLGAPLVPAVLKNPWASMFYEDGLVQGKNPAFMEALYTAVTESVIEAVEDMTAGQLYYGSADASAVMHDKRDPAVFDPDIVRLRFVPDDASRTEIWVTEAGIHPVSLGAGGDQVSGDFPYYLREYVAENDGARLAFIQGAELAITNTVESVPVDETKGDVARAAAVGEALGRALEGITEEKALPALLNVSIREVKVPVDNPVHTLAGREALLSSVFVRDGLGYDVITELGYMELGGTLGVVTVPGEIDPAILFGGAISAQESWTGESWDYTPWAETCGAERLVCFGLCNDQIGYILCGNDIRSMLTENEEINAVSVNSAAVLTQAFEALIKEVK